MRLASLLLAALALTGCATLTPEMADTQRAVARVVPERAIEHRVAVGAGPFTMGFVRMAARLSGDSTARKMAGLLRHVSRARVRVYTLREGTRIAAERLTLPRSLARRGWTPVVRVRDEGAAVWVLAREQRGRITGLYTLALTDEALVVAQVSGRFDRLLEEALDPGNGFVPERPGGGPVVAARDTTRR
jgi:hypothetical protein